MGVSLSDFLTPLVTTNVQVVLKDMDLNILGKIYADSVDSLDETLLKRIVNKWDLTRNSLITVYLNDVEDETIVSVTGVELNQTSASVSVDNVITLVATVLPEDADNKAVSWVSSDETIATVENGVVTGISEGTAVIYVTTDDGSFTASCVVNVEEQEEVIAVTGITLSSVSLNMVIWNTETVIATIEPEDATNQNVIWASSNEEIATVENGTITAISEGIAIITVTTEDGGFTANVAVTVNAE